MELLTKDSSAQVRGIACRASGRGWRGGTVLRHCDGSSSSKKKSSDNRETFEVGHPKFFSKIFMPQSPGRANGKDIVNRFVPSGRVRRTSLWFAPGRL